MQNTQPLFLHTQYIKLKAIFLFKHSQHSSLWVERFRGVDLVENGACVHQNLPDVVMIPSTNTKQKEVDNIIHLFPEE